MISGAEQKNGDIVHDKNKKSLGEQLRVERGMEWQVGVPQLKSNAV